MKASATLAILSRTESYDVSSVSCAYFKNSSKYFCAYSFFTHQSHVINLVIGKLCNWAFLSPVVGSVLNFIFKVSGSRVVSQVLNVVVAGVSIIVATIFIFWSRANKSGKHQGMNICRFSDATFIKVYNFSLNSVCVDSKLLSFNKTRRTAFSVFNQSINASHITKVRNFVKTLVTGYRFPDFLHVVAPSNAPKCKIHGSQWSDWFSGANLAMKLHYSKENNNG